MTARASDYLQQSTGGIQGFLSGTVATVINTIITLIVTFFLLSDIDRLRARFFYLLPEKARGAADEMGKDIGGVFSDYLRGLLIVCTLYGVCMIVMLYGLSFTRGHGRWRTTRCWSARRRASCTPCRISARPRRP